jgi:competence protein ComEC
LIVWIAFGYWLLLWLIAPTDSNSQIKQSYPTIDGIERIRVLFLGNLNGVTNEAAALVAGLTIGERGLVPAQLEEQMRDLSLTHLVAVSGANLAIVLGSIYFLTGALGLPRNLRFLSALVIMSLYVLLVGPESSVIRAATMALFVMLGLWLGRGSNPLYALSSAVLFLLLIDPGLATDVGFGLSAFATAGLVGLAPVIYQKLETKLGKVLAAGVAATAAAQIYTLPIILYLQPSLPLYSVIANLLVEVAVAPITILGLISVVSSPFSPLLATIFSLLASLGAQWIVIVAGALSQLPFVRMHFLPGIWGIAVATLVALLLTVSLRSDRFRSAANSAIAVVLVFSISWITTDVIRHKTFAGEWQIYACDVGQGDAMLIRSQGQTALVDVGPDPESIASCLQDAKVDVIDLLVLTHFDSDHVGGLAGAIDRLKGDVLISPFLDSRSIVKKTEDLVQTAGSRTIKAFSGMQGVLGEIRWLVLSPSANAAEAVDSNDASVVMAFDFGSFALLSLGDLGEEGQLRIYRQHQSLLDQLSRRELIVKVAHHGSADQLDKLYNQLDADFGLFLVGENRYGHPTPSALKLIESSGVVLRTDLHGPIALNFDKTVRYRIGGKLSA